jgi:predicted ABC-type exoprotein transport system permease subunit
MIGPRFLFALVALLAMFALAFAAPPVTIAQEPSAVEQVSNSKFRAALLKAAQASAKNGDIRRFDVMRLRVATLSPSFLKQAEELAVIQIVFSGEESEFVPFDSNGKVEVNRIDWEGLIAFLERLVPLILKLIDLFAAMNMQLESFAILDGGASLLATSTFGRTVHVYAA